MLSGIGPKEHLEEFNIPVKANLPVGHGMSDHVLPIINVRVDHDSMPSSNILSIGSKLWQGLSWLLMRSGPLASNSITDLTAFANTECYDFKLRRLLNDRPECELPNLQLIYAYIDKGLLSMVKSLYEIAAPHSPEVMNQVVSANEESSFIVVSPVVLKPKSRGWVKLASSDPFEQPAIIPNYLSDKRDVEEMVRAIKLLEQVVETPAFKNFNASILKLHISECPAFDEEGYWECYSRHMTHSVQHAVGTAALGQVVDERLRVKGVKNLRIADASVLPHLPRGNTAAAIIAIGERLSDFLLQDRGLE
nr:glucose dehydrogenase [FAD, quinone]-like [Danaus plexippus plexippus]